MPRFPSWSKHGRTFGAAMFLVILIVFFFGQAIVRRATLVPLDIIEEFDVALNQDTIKSHNYLLSDTVDLFYPNYVYLREELRRGSFPWWNPYILCGIPFYADSQVGFFELTHLASYVLNISPLAFPLFSACILLFILGFSTYLYLKNLRYSVPVALFGAVSIMFGGTVIVWVQYALVWTFVWLPLMLLAVDRIILERRMRWLPILSTIICLSIFAGYPQVAVLNLLLTGSYALWRHLATSPREHKIFFALIGCMLLGVMMSAVQLGPSWNFIRRSESYEFGRGYIARDHVLDVVRNELNHAPAQLILAAKKIAHYGVVAWYPLYYGSPIERNYHNPEGNPYANFSEVTVYAGLLTIILATLSIWWFRRERTVRFWFIVGLVAFALAVDLPFLNLFKYLPLINKIAISRFRLFFVFAVALLSVSTLERLFRSLERRKTHLGTIVVTLLTIVCFGDLYHFFHTYNIGTEPQTNFITDNPAIKFLQANTGTERIIGIETPGSGFHIPLIPNMSTIVHLADVRGYNPIVGSSYLNFANQYLTRRGSSVLADAVFDERALDLMSVKYIICPQTECQFLKNTEAWAVAYTDHHVRIFENQHFLPRAFISYDWINTSTPIADLLMSNQFDPFQKVALDGPLSMSATVSTSSSIHMATIVENDPERMTIHAEANSPAVLVTTDRFDDGWHASVNGQPTTVLLANGLFRAVPIPKGTSEIVFWYRPKHFSLYAGISFVSLAGVVSLAFVLRSKSRTD